MNDFTKDELNYIADGLALVMGKRAMTNSIKDDLSQLYGKIESMIENYCDECNNSKKIDNMCNGQVGCCVYPCSNCKDIDNE